MNRDRDRVELGSVAEQCCTLEDFPFISLILLSRNEEKHIGHCLESLLNSDYPNGNFEILVVDGMSTDRTAEIVAEFKQRDPRVQWVENPKKITPAAMNIGVKAARGEVVAILGAHAGYSPHFLTHSVKYLYEYGADQAGIAVEYVPRNNTLIARSLARVIGHPFGAGGNAGYKRRVSRPIWVDSILFACFRRELFAKIGLFNEELVHSQDMEWNQRLRRAGGRILLAPELTNRYYARSDLKSFTKHNFRNGLWAILPFEHSTTIPVRWRHLVPLSFVLALMVTGILSLTVPAGKWLFAAVLLPYLLCCAIASVDIAVRERSWKFVPIMLGVFPLLHIVHGAGSIYGVLKLTHHVLAGRWAVPARASAD